MTQNKVPAALRIISMMCFVFALISMIPAFTGASWVYAVFLALCLCQEIAIQAVYKANKATVLRIILSLIPVAVAAPLLLLVYEGPRLLPSIALGAMWLWFLVYNARGSFECEYWRFKRTYIAYVAVTLLLCLVSVVFVMAYSVRNNVDINIPAILGFTAAGGLVGFIVLSEMRSGEPDVKWRLMNAARILGIFLLAALVLLLVFSVLRYLLSLIRPVEGPKPVRVEFQGEGVKMVHAPYGTNLDISDTAYKDANDMEDTVINYLEVEEQRGFPWQLVVFGVLVAALVAFLVWRRLIKRTRKVEKVEEELPPEEKERQDKVMKVRVAFKQYIDFVKAKGGEIEKGSTSEDVISIAHESEVSTENLSEAERTLREIYIKARYGKASDITDEDVETAQSCLETIVGEDGK